MIQRARQHVRNLVPGALFSTSGASHSASQAGRSARRVASRSATTLSKPSSNCGGIETRIKRRQVPPWQVVGPRLVLDSLRNVSEAWTYTSSFGPIRLRVSGRAHVIGNAWRRSRWAHLTARFHSVDSRQQLKSAALSRRVEGIGPVKPGSLRPSHVRCQIRQSDLRDKGTTCMRTPASAGVSFWPRSPPTHVSRHPKKRHRMMRESTESSRINGRRADTFVKPIPSRRLAADPFTSSAAAMTSPSWRRPC